MNDFMFFFLKKMAGDLKRVWVGWRRMGGDLKRGEGGVEKEGGSKEGCYFNYLKGI